MKSTDYKRYIAPSLIKKSFFKFTLNNSPKSIEINKTLENKEINKKDLKEDISEDLNRLGNDWKSDPNQQEETKIAKEEFLSDKKKEEEEFERPENYNIG